MTWLGPRSPSVRAAGSCSATVKPDRPSMLSRQSSDSTCSRADSPCSVMESPTMATVGRGSVSVVDERVARMTMVARIAEETSPNSTATSQMRFGPPSAAPLLAVPVTGGQPTGPPVAGSIRLVVSPAHPSPTTGLPTRARLAVATGRAVAGASKLVHFGSGSVIGGRAALLVDGDLLRQLTRDREVVIVSATNGKTTTTRLIGAALGTDRPVVSNSLGANMTPGIVAALGVADPAATAVLEVDERWVEDVLAATGAGTVVLLNLSRDQLDRTQEVRKLAERWRRALTATPPARVVANADDPLVTWAASAAPEVIWVATGQDWNSDAAGCPNCSGRIAFEPGAWRCTGCDLARPTPDVTIDEMTWRGAAWCSPADGSRSTSACPAG